MTRFVVFFNDTATTEIYTLSLHDALPIFSVRQVARGAGGRARRPRRRPGAGGAGGAPEVAERSAACRRVSRRRTCRRSEEHTSELQSRQYLVCRLLLEKKTMTLSDRVQQN